MNESTTLKPAFQAFRLGNLSIQEIFEQFRNILLETNDAADSLLQEIDSAYEEDLISAQVVTELRSFVVNTITTTGENKHTDIDATRIEATRGNTDSLLDSQTWSAPSGLTATGEVGTGSVLRQRFVLHEKLGGGGMGTVSRGIDMLKKEARDRHPDVAVKVLNANFNTHKDAFIAL